jgi:hypothetical protein
MLDMGLDLGPTGHFGRFWQNAEACRMMFLNPRMKFADFGRTALDEVLNPRCDKSSRILIWAGEAAKRANRLGFANDLCSFWHVLTMFVLRCGRFVVLTYFDSYDFTSKTHRSTQI